MKRKIFILITVFVTMFTLASCFSFEGVKSLSINYTLKEKYIINEEVILNNIEVVAELTSGSTESLNYASTKVSKLSGHRLVGQNYLLDTTQVGIFTLKISYEGVVFEVDYEVVRENVWDGSTYTPVAEVDNVYEVRTPDELAWLAQQSASNTFSGKTIKILSDLDFGMKPWIQFTYIKDIVIDGLKADNSRATISGLSKGFIKQATNITIQNLIFDFNVDTTGSFRGLIASLKPTNAAELTNARTTLIKNVEVKGKVIAGEGSTAFLGYGTTGATEEQKWKEDIYFENCKSTLSLTALGESNIGQLMVHTNFHHIFIDEETINKTTGIVTAFAGDNGLASSTAGKYFGYHQQLDIYVKRTGATEYTKMTAEEFNTTFNNRGYNIIASSNLPFDVSKIGSYVDTQKIDGATKLVVTLSYLVGRSYGRYETVTVNIRSFDAGQTVVAPLKFKYVSQNPDSVNWPNYIYNNEKDIPDVGSDGGYHTLTGGITVYVTQMNSEGTILSLEKYSYNNVPER